MCVYIYIYTCVYLYVSLSLSLTMYIYIYTLISTYLFQHNFAIIIWLLHLALGPGGPS